MTKAEFWPNGIILRRWNFQKNKGAAIFQSQRNNQAKLEQHIQYSPIRDKFQIYFQNELRLRSKLNELYNNI